MNDIELEMRDVEREYNAGLMSLAEYERTMYALEKAMAEEEEWLYDDY